MFYKIVGVLKGVLENFANFTKNSFAGYDLNGFIHLASTFIIKEAPSHSCLSVSLNETNAWKLVFYLPFFTEKLKQSKSTKLL